MDIFTYSIPFIAAILGIAYPILLQVIARLDDKYGSTLIVNLFDIEEESKVFKGLLICSLISILLFVFFKMAECNSAVLNSVEWLSLFISVGLMISFFLFIEKILIYIRTEKFVKYLIEKDKIEQEKIEHDQKNFEYFRAISDILYFSIRKQDEKIARTISDHFSNVFYQFRKKNSNLSLEYPYEFYKVILISIEELATIKTKKLYFVENGTVGANWLLGSLGEDSEINETTYLWIWANINMALKYERDDFITNYWGTAYNYMKNNLDLVMLHMSNDYSKVKEAKIQKARERFLEFHYALGGLLLYKKRYNCVYKIFSFTMSLPPSYVLFPETMDEVFEKFFDIRILYEEKHYNISHRYTFPEIEGLKADGLIKHWICKYVALLFLRQYLTKSYLINIDPLREPQIPTKQGEKRMWIDNLDYFKRLVAETLDNHDLLKATGLDFISDEWCDTNHKPKPLEFIESIKIKTVANFGNAEINQMPSAEKIDAFITATKNILTPAFSQYEIIENKKKFNEEINKFYITGVTSLFDKKAFAVDQESTYIDYDSYLPNLISTKFKKEISHTFFYSKSESYLLKPEDVFAAIDKLNIDSKQHIIIGFAFNISYYKNQLNVNELSENSYKGIELINFDTCEDQLVRNSFFILNKADLPRIVSQEIGKEEINKYELKPIDSLDKVYASVNDLNEKNELRESLEKPEEDKDIDLKKYVLLTISFIKEIQWKKNCKMIFLRASSPFSERGIPNDLKDVKPF